MQFPGGKSGLPKLSIKTFQRVNACVYYRSEIPGRVLEKLGLAEVNWESPWGEPTKKGLNEMVGRMVRGDAALWWSSAGGLVEHILRAHYAYPVWRDGFGNAFSSAVFISDLDDNGHFIHPFNGSFAKTGTRLPDGTLLVEGDVVDTKLESGEVITLYRDGFRGFDVKRNHKKMASQDMIIQKSHGVSFSVEPLREYYEEALGLENTYVLPNSVIEEDYPQVKHAEHPGEIRVLWQGGDNHYQDWYEIKEGIAWAVEKFPEVKWVIWGVDYPFIHDLIPRDRYEFHKWVPYEAYKYKLATIDFDFAIAPLVENRFAEAKSSIKVYEAGMVGSPSLAANVGPYRELEDGETAMLYSTPEEFREKFEMLVRNAWLRKNLTENLREWLFEHRDAEKTVPGWWKWVLETKEKWHERKIEEESLRGLEGESGAVPVSDVHESVPEE